MAAENMTVINQMKGYTTKEKECFNLGWKAAMELVEALKPSHNSASDEIAFLEKLQKCYFDTRCIDYKNVGFIMLTERIKQLRT